MPTIQFKGKNIIWNHHLSVPYHTLEEVPELHFQADKANGNLIVEGDNLIALKALLPEYAGKVKCIYIDPPYNTGNENGVWVYNDNVNSPLITDWLGKEVGEDDLLKSDKWLCMMTPRLRLLRDLLSNDGVIVISIDDYEADHLKILMSEIFGGQNFVGLLPTIMNLKGNQDEFGFAGTHEYTLVWAKDKSLCKINEFNIDDEELEDWLEDDYGYYKKGANLKATGQNGPREKRQNLYYPLLFKDGEISTITIEEYDPIYNKETKTFNDNHVDLLKGKYESEGYTFILPISDGQFMSWRWQHSKVVSEPHNIIVSEGEDGVAIYKKQRPSIGDIPSKKPKSTLYKPEYSSGNGTNQLKQLFGDKVFPNPKPPQLIEDLILLCSEPGDYVLDSFAGSGTTGNAVSQLHKEGLGLRKYILIQMKEDSEKEPDKNICKDITRERNKRAIEKFNYNTGFKYFRVGNAIDPDKMLDGQLPTYEEFAKYVYYLATGEHLADVKKIDQKKHFVGTHGPKNFYLIYEQDFDKLTRLALNLHIAEDMKKHATNKRMVVYAPACFLDSEYLEEKQIEFVSIPYNLFEKKEK
jgi:adenine-specific DNA-methyltransferase